jgi:hypothetical protein
LQFIHSLYNSVICIKLIPTAASTTPLEHLHETVRREAAMFPLSSLFLAYDMLELGPGLSKLVS